jgi:hypothetical protein
VLKLLLPAQRASHALLRMPSDLLLFECFHATHDESIQVTAAVNPLALHVLCACPRCLARGQGAPCACVPTARRSHIENVLCALCAAGCADQRVCPLTSHLKCSHTAIGNESACALSPIREVTFASAVLAVCHDRLNK